MLSLISITTTGILTSIHHIYRFEFTVLIPALIVVILPTILMGWFWKTSSKVALWLYGLFNALIIVWFGIVDGGLDHTLRAISEMVFIPLGISALVVDIRMLPPSELTGDFFYELTGILSFITSVFAAYYGYKFIQAVRRNNYEIGMM
jgi:hypothetical protein